MKKILYSLSFIALLMSSACKKMLDINENPNNPTEEEMTADLFLPTVLHNTALRMATQYEFAARWMGYWSRSGTFGPNTEEESYNITTNFQSNQWAGWYSLLFDVHTMEQKAKAADQTFYVAIAKTLKTIGFMNLVDQYNNIPYEQAFDLKKYIQPAYTKGEDIYTDLLKQLDTASTLLQDINIDMNPHIEQMDIMFHGDPDLWRRFVNTQRLKLLIRQSQTGKDLSAEYQKILDEGEGLIGTGQTAAVNPGYVRGDGKQNPFWDNYETNYLGSAADSYNRANNFILNIFKGTNDIRFMYVFDRARSPLTADPYVGYDYGWPGIDGQLPVASNSSGVGGPGLARRVDQDQWIFTSTESLFLQAEAIQRGLLPGNAEEAYKAAVREAFYWLRIPDSADVANEYLESGDAIVDWSQATTDDAKLELIITQKYLALIGVNNFEAWVDYRRMGVPHVTRSRAPSAGPNVPVRLRYPQVQYSYNAANVAKENNPDPFTSGVFWDK
jgi:hypothetical protein